MKTIFDHLRECAGNGDTPTLDAEDAQRIVETYDDLLEALKEAVKIIDEEWDIEWEQGHAAIKRATDA